jgi:hypothetical protein
MNNGPAGGAAARCPGHLHRPFAGAGFLVYVVDQQRRTVELVGMIWLGF